MFPYAGALASKVLAAHPAGDVSIERIDELTHTDLPPRLGAARAGGPAGR
jgi:hypothetical protein